MSFHDQKIGVWCAITAIQISELCSTIYLQNCIYVLIIHGILAETQDSFFSVDDGDVSGALANRKKIRLFGHLQKTLRFHNKLIYDMSSASLRINGAPGQTECMHPTPTTIHACRHTHIFCSIIHSYITWSLNNNTPVLYKLAMPNLIYLLKTSYLLCKYEPTQDLNSSFILLTWKFTSFFFTLETACPNWPGNVLTFMYKIQQNRD